jgi:ABC-type glycerol-3-phosphate transport system substrate-binding protein
MDLNKVNKDNIVYYKDKPLGIKLMENNVKFIWNKEIFKKAGLDPNKPPKNWGELIEYSNKIKNKFPDITTFAFPFKEYEDMNITIGEPSVNSGSIYTTFWNYKEGKYDFSYAKSILNTYKDLYSKNILEEDFDKKSKNQLRSEFYQEKIAMMISTYEDKAYFSNILPLSFEVGISNVMQVDEKSKNKYYFTNNLNFLVLNKASIEKTEDDTEQSIQEKTKKTEAIKKVYEYLVSNEVNNEILQTKNALPINVNNSTISNDVYSGYNDVNDFSNQRLDPTIFLSRNSRYELNLILDAIKSKSSVEKVIEDLNKQYKKYYDFAIDKEKFDFEYYKMK